MASSRPECTVIRSPGRILSASRSVRRGDEMSPDGEEQGPEPAPVEGLLDLTDEPPGPPPRALVDLRDIEQQREEMRGIIALSLVALFSLVMIGALSAVILGKAA